MKGHALAILIGKGKKSSSKEESMEDDDEYQKEAKIEAASSVIDAMKEGNPEALSEALTDFYKMCSMEY